MNMLLCTNLQSMLESKIAACKVDPWGGESLHGTMSDGITIHSCDLMLHFTLLMCVSNVELPKIVYQQSMAGDG